MNAVNEDRVQILVREKSAGYCQSSPVGYAADNARGRDRGDGTEIAVEPADSPARTVNSGYGTDYFGCFQVNPPALLFLCPALILLPLLLLHFAAHAADSETASGSAKVRPKPSPVFPWLTPLPSLE